MLLNDEKIKELLNEFNIVSFSTKRMIDSSHDESDIRENYIIDNKYVLRVNSFEVMTNERIIEINNLVDKYLTIKIESPKFIRNKYGDYVIKKEGYVIYLSEYLDYPLADDLPDLKVKLVDERIDFISRFANKYKNVDLVETKSMYSLFDLAPYDIPLGIDEKQQNCDELMETLTSLGETRLANQISDFNSNIRIKLKKVYKTLPRCVFQGDENFSNICVKDNHIVGLFDFNMYGTDVIANYLANIAFQTKYRYDKEFEEINKNDLLNLIVNDFRNFTDRIEREYSFEVEEKKAYKLYAKLVMVFSFCNVKAFIYYLKNEHKDKCLKLLNGLISLDL